MFRRKPLISDDLHDWITANFDWVVNQRPDWWNTTQLIRPTSAFFLAPAGQGHETAVQTCQDIARLLCLDMDFELEPLPDLPDELMHQYGVLTQVAGEYWHDDEYPVITYDPKLLRRPLVFINTMAHELMHARLATVVDDLPGGSGAHELATDLHCIIAGFGLFQLQAAEEAGWAGYMSQPSRAIALAEFLKRKGIPAETAFDFLSARPNKWLKKALKELG